MKYRAFLIIREEKEIVVEADSDKQAWRKAKSECGSDGEVIAVIEDKNISNHLLTSEVKCVD
ncbi:MULTISPECIES: hypothetical protein [Burkholderia cepacia complex]|uniref:hypothetical protein n=1 Tax=Burkholderia cenocepacia TaxID=95486 RepID=UPI0022377F68|nr:hypothetical protein [Burkholderia cenocepacia]MCW5156432.1 hypothetical protein [Burkholderia cenocepacia]